MLRLQSTISLTRNYRLSRKTVLKSSKDCVDRAQRKEAYSAADLQFMPPSHASFERAHFTQSVDVDLTKSFLVDFVSDTVESCVCLLPTGIGSLDHSNVKDYCHSGARSSVRDGSPYAISSSRGLDYFSEHVS